MPIKRWHTKSRKGCFACKRRRVKCDEQQPVCGRCLASAESCMYPSELHLSPDDSNVPSHTLAQNLEADKMQSPQTDRKKRWHSKSRHSCSNCKKRHIKCDARVPTCSNCIRREVSCDLLSTTNQLASRAPRHVHNKSEGVRSMQLALTATSTRRDLLIFHHYTSTVAKLLAREQRMPIAYYIEEVPRVALASDACLHALLGYSAMHHAVAYEAQSANRTMYTDIAQRYYHKAIGSAGEFMARDGTVLPHQAAAMSLFCCFAGFTLLLIFNEECSLEEDDKRDYITTFSSLSRLWKGKSLCQGLSLPQNNDSGPDASHQTKLMSEPTARTSVSDPVSHHEINDDISTALYFLDSHLQHVRSICRIGSGQDHDLTKAVDVCVEATRQLQIAWQIYQTSKKVKCILDWPVFARSELFDHMQSGKAEANAVALCYGLMLNNVTSDWHVSDFGRGLAQQALQIVERTSLTLGPICQLAWKLLGNRE